MRPKSCQFMRPVPGPLSLRLCRMGRTTRGTSGRAREQFSVGELLTEDGERSSSLSSGRSNSRLIENELSGPQLGRLTG